MAGYQISGGGYVWDFGESAAASAYLEPRTLGPLGSMGADLGETNVNSRPPIGLCTLSIARMWTEPPSLLPAAFMH